MPVIQTTDLIRSRLDASRRFTIVAMAAAIMMLALMTGPKSGRAQILGGGGLGSRLDRFKQNMSSKDTSHMYNASVMTPGTPRSQVIAAFGQPNGTQTSKTGAPEDVYCFFPDGAKYIEPQIHAGTIAAAVFTGGISLATREARIEVQKNQLTIYHIRYDAYGNIQSVKTIPPNLPVSEPSAVPPT
jgi:hypothetical protein